MKLLLVMYVQTHFKFTTETDVEPYLKSSGECEL